jgi:3',5'-cyclic AMP phosphodiesterase CpdA
MTDTLTIAHLSDLHLTPLAGFGPRHWNVKRTLGYLNWHRGRKRVHRPETVAALLADLAMQPVDHVAVTGDIVNIGLPSEHAAALRWLEGLGSAERVSVVPGNHDIYVRLASDPGVERWRAYMASDTFGAGIGVEPVDGFPFVRRLARVALIGVNSAVPTPPFVAAGCLGPRQLGALARALDAVRKAGLVRVVLIHHPPLPGQAPPRRALSDAAELERVLSAHGAELVLHGHNHRDMLTWLETATGRTPVVGIASGSAARAHKDEPLARYNLFRFTFDGATPAIHHTARGLAQTGGPVVELEHRLLG